MTKGVRLTFVAVAVIVLAGDATAQQIYKCNQSDGSITFSDHPCGDNARSVYIEDSQSGISTNQSYHMPLTERAERNRVARDSDAASMERVQREAQREFNRAIREGKNTRAATRAANIVMSKAHNPRGAEAQREYNRMIKQGYNSAAAERAANVVLGQPGAPSAVEPLQHSMASQQYADPIPPANPIPSNRSGVYIPTSPDGSQYVAPGGGICNREGSNLNCAGTVKPANGMVIEPP